MVSLDVEMVDYGREGLSCFHSQAQHCHMCVHTFITYPSVINSVINSVITLYFYKPLYTLSMAMTAEGRIFTWGKGSSGQLGHGDALSLHHPREIRMNNRPSSSSPSSFSSFSSSTSSSPVHFFVHFTSIACGYEHALASTSEGHLYVNRLYMIYYNG